MFQISTDLFGLLFIPLLILMGVIGLVCFIFWLWMEIQIFSSILKTNF